MLDVLLRVSLIGIELLTVDARVVLASVDTYLRFAEAVNRLDLGSAEGEGLPELVQTAPERVARPVWRSGRAARRSADRRSIAVLAYLHS